MPLTTFDANTALVVIDLQNGIAGLPTVHAAADIISRSAQLTRAFRKAGLPVVLVNVSGRAPGRTDAGAPKLAFTDDWIKLVPELEPQPGDHLVTKQRFGAFIGTDMDAYLRGKGVTQIVLTGISTSIGVESTARSAYDLGYNVTIVTDAVTDMNPEAHRHAVEVIFPRLSETTTTGDVLTFLQKRQS